MTFRLAGMAALRDGGASEQVCDVRQPATSHSQQGAEHSTEALVGAQDAQHVHHSGTRHSTHWRVSRLECCDQETQGEHLRGDVAVAATTRRANHRRPGTSGPPRRRTNSRNRAQRRRGVERQVASQSTEPQTLSGTQQSHTRTARPSPSLTSVAKNTAKNQ